MARKSDAKAAKAHRLQLKSHSVDQAKHRAKNKAKRRPERDDVANAALRLLLTSTVRHPEWATAWTTNIARDLGRLKNPFDPVETAAVFEAMIERHREVMERAAERELQE
jgi:Arc/MetJ-type ribon-helix-helix transcriptional regulator